MRAAYMRRADLIRSAITLIHVDCCSVHLVERDGSLGRRPRLADLRHLPERQVLVESLRGQAFDSTGQERDERAARRIWSPGSAVEVDGNPTAGASVLEESQ